MSVVRGTRVDVQCGQRRVLGGVTQAMICGSDRQLAAVRAVSYTPSRVSGRAGLPAGDGAGGGVEAVLGQDAGRVADGDVGQPRLHVGQRSAGAGGGEDEAGQQVLRGQGPEVFAAAGVGADLGDEVVGEPERVLPRRGEGEGVPPPRAAGCG